MKSQEQVLRYISQNSFPNKDDWRNVLAWCKGHYGGGKAHKALKPIGNSTYAQFMTWRDNGIAVGDIVKVDDFFGIVGGYGAECSFLSNIIVNGELITQKTWVKSKDIIPATDDEQQEVFNLMKKQKVQYSVSLSRLVDTYIPGNGDFVRIMQGKKVMLGIYHSQIDNQYSFHGIVSRNRFTGERLFSVDEVNLVKASKTETERISAALAVSGLVWLPESKKIVEAIGNRAKKGDYFWYMSERLMPESDRDTYNQRCDEKFQCGNYFRSFKECYEFCMKVQVLRKEQ